MAFNYLFRGLISSLAIFGVFNRLKVMSLKETALQVILGTLAYGLFGGTGYTVFLIGGLLISLTLKLPIFKKVTE